MKSLTLDEKSNPLVDVEITSSFMVKSFRNCWLRVAT